MKKVSFLLVTITIIMQASFAQSVKNIVVDANAAERKVSNFSAIEVSGAIDVYLSQGSVDAVAISASTDEIRDKIKTEVQNGTLHIYFDGNSWNWKNWGNTKMKAYITFKNLNRIEASGACNVITTSPIKVNDFKIDFSGASDFSGDIVADNIIVETSGASNIKLRGKATKATVGASGASNIKAYDYKVDFCNAEASGASNIKIYINKELHAEASGGSGIYYKGEGIIRSMNTSGAASIKKKVD